jgi:tetratricopeptide (TPR) repeat protein
MPETMGGGGAFLDYDNDGWLDILLINGDYWPGHLPSGAKHPTLALYRNNHNGTFTEVTGQVGLAAALQGMGVAVGDYDNDGFDDLFLTAVGRSRLFHNVPDGQGGRKFVDVTDACGIRDTGWSTSAAWVDYDGDGKSDLFVCHYVRWSPETDRFCGAMAKVYCRPSVYAGESCRLYHNDGNGHFHDVSRQAGIENPGAKALAVCVCDIDRDDRPDLIVANDMEPTFVFHNNGDGTFREIGVSSGLAYDKSGHERAGMGIDAVDYRNNGALGIAIGDFSQEGMAFYETEGPPPYLDCAQRTGVLQASYPYVTFGVLFGDFDLDGWADLFATNGDIEDSISRSFPGQTYPQPNLLLRNNGAGAWIDVSRQAGAAVTDPMVGRGACLGDFDNDGRPDILLIPNWGPPRLLHNETATRSHWLTIQCVGTGSNRDGFGSRVSVTAGGITRTGYVHSGSSYLSASDRRLYFGLGSSAEVSRITVRWPGGTEEAWGPIAADQILTLTEGQSRSRPASPAAAATAGPQRAFPERPPTAACAAALQQGVAALQRGESAKAAQAFERAVRADPDSWLARDYLGIACLKQGLTAAALHQFQEEIRLAPDPSTGWARIADVYYAQHDVQRAIHALERAAALRPDRAQYYYNLGMLYPQALEMNKAIEALGRYSALEPGNHYAHYLRGSLLTKLARLDDAEQALGEAIRLAPDTGLYHYALAQVYFRRTATPETTERARAELQRALDDGAPEPAAVYYYLGLCYQRQGDREAARRALQTSVQMAPKAWGAYYALAEVLQSLGHPDEARKARARFALLRAQEDRRMQRSFYEQEIARNPESADARCQFAAYLLLQGDRPGAGAALARARSLAEKQKADTGLRRRIDALAEELRRPGSR